MKFVLGGDDHVDLSSQWSMMQEDERAWLVEFYSPMCGSCKEFEPVFKRVSASLGQNIAVGTVNIDTKEGMNIAKSLGVLEEGLPNVRLMDRRGGASKGTSILKDFITASPDLPQKIIEKVKAQTQFLSRRDDGFHLKV